MRLLLVPGFTQTPASWDGVRTHLDPTTDVHALALPVAASFVATAAALAERGGRGAWCGYSMGGRLALRLALDRPDLVTALVLVSATPGIDDAVERDARVAADDELAASIERDGTTPFLDRWLAQPMFVNVAHDAPGVAERTTWTAAQLAATLRTLGTGTMNPMWARLHELTMPVLIVTGDLDEKFTAIGDAMARQIAGARRGRLACGHAVPLERPSELAALLHDFTNAPASNTDTAS